MRFVLLLLVLVAISACIAPAAPAAPKPNVIPNITSPAPQPNVTPPPIPAPTNSTTPTAPSIANVSVQEVKMMIFHTSYNPNTITAKVGQKVRISAVADFGTSAHKHGVTIDALAVNRAVVTTDASNPEIIEFTPTTAGTFTMYCGTCKDGIFGTGHPDIRGTLTVQP